MIQYDITDMVADVIADYTGNTKKLFYFDEIKRDVNSVSFMIRRSNLLGIIIRFSKNNYFDETTPLVVYDKSGYAYHIPPLKQVQFVIRHLLIDSAIHTNIDRNDKIATIDDIPLVLKNCICFVGIDYYKGITTQDCEFYVTGR